MAETLGSLIDKLSIKSIREFNIQKMIGEENKKFDKKELEQKLGILNEQREKLLTEIEEFIDDACRKGVVAKDEKLKLYNDREAMDQIGDVDSVAKGIMELTKKNFQLWELEDEARRKDVEPAYIGEVKCKIDLANQQRNDLIDRIDEVLQKKIREKTGHDDQ
ncbi:MAG TPA: DUF4254 domain-containing protein [Smithellaceae bacterium]|nr:DUF4254 domain-containing protein [Smithellaceae bacterium]